MLHHPEPPRPSRSRSRSRKVACTAALAALLTAGLIGCGTTDTDDGAKTADTDASGQTATPGAAVAATDEGCTDEVATATGPVTMTDDFDREVKLDQPASKVAVLEWQQTEALLTLCVAPVAVADAEGYATWVNAVDLPEGTTDVGQRGEPNINAVLATDPDLVIVEVTEKDDPVIEQFEKKGVPVLVTTGADAEDPIQHMIDTFQLIAKATGRTERADAVVAEFQKDLDDAKAEVAAADLPGLDFVYLDGWLQGGNVALRPFGQGSLVGEVGEAIGLTNAWTGPVDEAYGLGQTDIEGFAEVDATWVFHTGYDGPDPEAEDAIAALQANPIWNELPAVQAGRLTSFTPGTWTFGGPRSTQQVIAEFLTAVDA
jgi:ABC-type Fe3+-hydroxamate transport system substrate-binding protein